MISSRTLGLPSNALRPAVATNLDWSRNVLVLYLERPATQQCAGACSWAGRFGYSDLKEAALMEGYVL